MQAALPILPQSRSKRLKKLKRSHLTGVLK
jgi:hypothetical protein